MFLPVLSIALCLSPFYALLLVARLAMAALVEGSAQLIQESSRFMARLRRRQHGSSEAIARKTLEIMRLLIATTSAKDISSLIASIKQAGVVLSSAQPHELTIGNMVRRVLSLVREETSANEFEADDDDEGGILSPGNTIGSAEGGGPSLMRMLDVVKAPDYSDKAAKSLKGPILEAVNELLEELTSASVHIAEQAIEHIHANEIVLTHGRDPTVEAFLRAAHKKRPFEVIVAEVDSHRLFLMACFFAHIPSPTFFSQRSFPAVYVTRLPFVYLHATPTHHADSPLRLTTPTHHSLFGLVLPHVDSSFVPSTSLKKKLFPPRNVHNPDSPFFQSLAECRTPTFAICPRFNSQKQENTPPLLPPPLTPTPYPNPLPPPSTPP